MSNSDANGNGQAMVRHGGEGMSLAPDPEIVEMAIINGDLAKLSADERTRYYMRTCESLGLNPYTRPFEYIMLNGKLTFYARRDCAEQLRKINRVTVRILSREVLHDDIYVVTAHATMPDGRQDESTGVVSLGNLRGEALANAYMKAETKAKRRVTLSICGLGWLDESETDSIEGARRVEVEGGPPPRIPPASSLELAERVSQAVEEGVAASLSTNGADRWRKAVEDFVEWCRTHDVPRADCDTRLATIKESVRLRVAAKRSPTQDAPPSPASESAA